jgi:hypothetical protein|tara:strand:- start:139 stop:417 length:279 start_codon:yes stop_codon:yes gene_type:complete
MNPIPFNRHILVLKQEAKEEDTLVLVPDEYKQKSPFTLATVVESAFDCKATWTPGTTLVVPTHAIETLSFDGKDFYLVLENHILMGLFDKNR